MFDDPKKELRELEDQLLAAQTNEQKFEEVYDEILDEFGPGAQADAPAEPDIRNFANGYGRAAVTAPEVSVPDDSTERSIRRLTVLASIECAAIAAVAIYWFFHFL